LVSAFLVTETAEPLSEETSPLGNLLWVFLLLVAPPKTEIPKLVFYIEFTTASRDEKNNKRF
jgi:hypothetical protein